MTEPFRFKTIGAFGRWMRSLTLVSTSRGSVVTKFLPAVPEPLITRMRYRMRPVDFGNYIEMPYGTKFEKQPLSIGEITEELFELTGNWPRRVGDQLFAANGDQVAFLTNVSKLFASRGRGSRGREPSTISRRSSFSSKSSVGRLERALCSITGESKREPVRKSKHDLICAARAVSAYRSHAGRRPIKSFDGEPIANLKVLDDKRRTTPQRRPPSEASKPKP